MLVLSQQPDITHHLVEGHYIIIDDQQRILYDEKNRAYLLAYHQCNRAIEILVNRVPALFLGMHHGTKIYGVMAQDETYEPLAFHAINDALSRVCIEEYALITRAVSLLSWQQSTQYCGYCGSKNNLYSQGFKKVCSACFKSHYPACMPMIEVCIRRQNHILLARSVDDQAGIFTTLPCKISAGYSAEQAIEDMMTNQMGLSVDQITYVMSQSWPQDNQLVMGFMAHYISGQLVNDQDQFQTIQWFDIDNLPLLPSPMTMAYQLIAKTLSQTPYLDMSV